MDKNSWDELAGLNYLVTKEGYHTEEVLKELLGKEVGLKLSQQLIIEFVQKEYLIARNYGEQNPVFKVSEIGKRHLEYLNKEIHRESLIERQILSQIETNNSTIRSNVVQKNLTFTIAAATIAYVVISYFILQAENASLQNEQSTPDQQQSRDIKKSLSNQTTPDSLFQKNVKEILEKK